MSTVIATVTSDGTFVQATVTESTTIVATADIAGPQGPEGPPGLDGQSINWLGAYNGSTAYETYDAVSYNGSSYIAIQDTQGNLPTNSTYWNLLAQKGDQGSGAGDVTSVNGQIGDVVLDASDVGADPAGSASQAEQDANDYTDTAIAGINYPVDSVNGQTNVVVLDTDDISDTASNRYTNDTDIARLANTSGTNTGDQDLSGLVPNTRTVNGHPLSSNVTVTKSDVGLGNVDNTSDANKPISTATQTALDGKVDENASITGATKTKITYDSKGLVTAGADATTADIADSSNKRYVTDAQLVVIGNTSGTNTGDQTATTVSNTPAGNISATTVQGAINELDSEKQPIDSDLTTIAGLTPTTDNFMVATASAWASRTPTQARTQLGLGTVATLSSIDLTSNVTGILPIANGGTNASSQVNNGVTYFDGTRIKSVAGLNFSGTQLGIGAVADSVLTVAAQTTIVAPVSGSTSHYVGADGNSLRVTYDTHNNAGAGGTALFGRRSRGTAGTPSATQSGDTILSLNGQGYGTSQYPAASTGLIAIKARENFTNTANGTDITFTTTPNGSVTAAEVARFTDTALRLGVVGTMVGTLLFSGSTSGTVTLVAPAAAGSGTLTLPTGTDTLVGKATTDTLTNKRRIPRVFTTTSTATLTPEIDTYDIFHVTAQAAAINVANHSTSTPSDGEQIRIRFLDNGTARAITWGTNYVAKGGIALPSTTVLGKNLELGFEWNANLTKWNLLASAQEA